ncbi:tetratricopeptide repeat protein 39B-like isoform X2 [Neocloeon triangulifer]|uniref:tetratricopeptide repeat protein 39B-like isoform X2 n=1 Tax=Neocloeon triangulifer TaxID=2078957 RepID=UPI00286F1753|nr:tetratricopeptide repeat protein 39B-like isoform X2 [Neocloeon triangulifer]
MDLASVQEALENEEFQDACETLTRLPDDLSLEATIDESFEAVHLFFNNKFDEARNLLQPLAKCSMYHALGLAVFKYLEAILTFEEEHISVASDALKNCINVCNQYRRKNTFTESLGKMVKKTNYDSYTPEEVHAELCYAEALLLKSALTIIEDETLVSFIKAGLKIRSCFASYRECSHMLSSRTWTKDCHKIHFESGVRMGVGGFNLMISLLPARVIKLLEFIGFTGSKQIGLRELETGYKLDKSLRQVLCTMTLLGYHLIIVFTLNHVEGDTKLCETILQKELKKYPNGVWFLFFKGRLEFVKGNISSAIDWYTKSWKSQDLWPQFHHLCFWELMWANCLNQDWRTAASFAERLVQESRWSKTVYMYQKASMLAMLGDNLTADEAYEIERLIQEAPKFKQRIAGKSLPMEKFIVKRSERYFKQKKHLVLPAIELLYLWNLFRILGKDWKFAESVFRLIEKMLNAPPVATEYLADNRALLLLLKGACLRQMNKPLLAEEALREAISFESKIKEDNFIVPYAVVELALLLLDQKDREKAAALLEDAKKNYTGYSLESRLHFKIHSALTELSEKRNGKTDSM